MVEEESHVDIEVGAGCHSLVSGTVEYTYPRLITHAVPRDGRLKAPVRNRGVCYSYPVCTDGQCKVRIPMHSGIIAGLRSF